MHWLHILAAALPFILGTRAHSTPVGVQPDLAIKYTPKGDTWTCLDGSATIPWKAVNDDYCDCKDGSDEPGTSACPNSIFYCSNVGHLGSVIPSSRVNDGLCEKECCDGSDEAPGVCPNVCESIGAEYRRIRDAERKLRKTGSKIRSSYIAYAKKEKTNLEAVIAASAQEIAMREKDVAHLQEIADRAESVSASALERKKNSPLYNSLITHSKALASLKREHDAAHERTKALEEILSSLREGYNPNYQDMAVLEAVRGWEHFAGIKPDGEETEGEEETQEDAEEELEEGMWSKERLESNELDNLLKTDHVGLLLAHDEFAEGGASNILFDVTSYLPDALLPTFTSLTATLVDTLSTLGLAHAPAASSGSSAAREAAKEAEHSLSLAREEKRSAEQEHAELFDVEGFGAEGEWKKLQGLCLDRVQGDYTYEVCLFDEARQKPNRGGSTFSLGKWVGWNDAPGVEVGSPEYYSKQRYEGGAKCWNGPNRSLQLLLTCGLENAITSVIELEKCEYQLEGTTPALCLPLGEAGKVKDEL
ncbi:hypothetical protein FIBSPDRAFT_910677 [Athelia psychrophila]|uniref:Glucosidase 2 subunit beta n=1 Tax=Athelia psychrophila TaxID=1759441 RepID=A0A166KB75_9AGAM|nr:hypothetical protein FIBSPDRAFT_910677 [Fibularhizoctonia sp. CBS 109695]